MPTQTELVLGIKITTKDRYFVLDLDGVRIQPRKGKAPHRSVVLDFKNVRLSLHHGQLSPQPLSSCTSN